MTATSSTAWAGRITGWVIMPGRSNSSKKRSSWCRRIRRSTTIWVTPIGRAAACRKRAINGSGHCSSGHKRTRSSRSRRSCRAASRRRRPRPRTAAEPTEGGVAVKAFAPAKINLYLHVIGRRASGYHLLDSLIAFADIGDTITAAPADTLTLTVDGPEAAGIAGLGDDNLVLRAARLLNDRGRIEAGADLTAQRLDRSGGRIGAGNRRCARPPGGVARRLARAHEWQRRDLFRAVRRPRCRARRRSRARRGRARMVDRRRSAVDRGAIP